MKKFLVYFPFFFFSLTVIAQTEIVIKDTDLTGGQTHTWTKNNTYLLDGFVFLEDGGILNIEAGTVIKGKESPSTSDNASALIITRGAKINAIGTPQEPIIFTTEIDDINDDAELLVTDRGFWGGLIILGYGQLANTTAETRVEGIPDGEDRALFGGDNDADNSGVLQFVSIRHGGAELAPGDEINGLTLGAVGSGTIIENIEVIANQDDGIEFFGGAVNVKYASVAFCGDDNFDWDLGWKGKGQFWLAMTGEDDGDNGGELDGAKPDDGTPTSNPTIYNATFIGAGCGTDVSAKNATGLLFRDGSAGKINNSVITDYNFGIEVEDRAAGVDSRQRMEEGDLVIANNIWWNICNGTELNTTSSGFIRATPDAEDASAQFLMDHLAANNNTNTAHGMKISRIDDGNFNPLSDDLKIKSADYISTYPTDDFFTPVCYAGAFGDEVVWLQNWTALATYGVLDPNVTYGEATASEICNTTAIEEIEIQDKGYTLIQNNPNPTTATTQIGFTLAEKKTINLTVFDYTGKEVVRMISNATYPAGFHSIDLEVSNLANGVYFYTLSNDEVVLTKQLVVLK